MTGFVAALVVIGVAGSAVPVLQWLGRLPRGNPTLISQRTYLFLPLTTAPLVLALGLVLGETLWAPLATVGLVLALLGCVAGGVLSLWQPEWLRPPWQTRGR